MEEGETEGAGPAQAQAPANPFEAGVEVKAALKWCGACCWGPLATDRERQSHQRPQPRVRFLTCPGLACRRGLWEVLKEHPEGLKQAQLVGELKSRGLLAEGVKNPSSQVRRGVRCEAWRRPRRARRLLVLPWHMRKACLGRDVGI